MKVCRSAMVAPPDVAMVGPTPGAPATTLPIVFQQGLNSFAGAKSLSTHEHATNRPPIEPLFAGNEKTSMTDAISNSFLELCNGHSSDREVSSVTPSQC